jgi:hypothetical protein
MEDAMSELTPEDDALIRQARLGLQPTSEDHARVRGKVLARVGLGLGAATATLSATGATAAATSGTALVLKALGTLVVVASVAGGAFVIHERRQEKTPASSPKVAIAFTPPSAAPENMATPLPESPSAPIPPLPVAPVDPPVEPHPPARLVAPSPPVRSTASVPTASTAVPLLEAIATPAPSDPPPAAVPAGPVTVAAEARLLRESDEALRSGDGARALALLDEHAATFPSGVLVEERMAERVVVLCALGRTAEAQQAAAVFLRDHDRSPLAARVRGSCASR